MFYLGRVVTQRMPASAAMGCGLDGMPVSVAVVQLSVLLGGTKCLTVAWLSSSSVSCVTNSGTGAKLAVQARVALSTVQTLARARTCVSVTTAID